MFPKEIAQLMYAFGHEPAPIPATVQAMDEALEWYINSLVSEAMNKSNGRLCAQDFMHVLESDCKKKGRAVELVWLDKELRGARAAFDVDGFE